MKLKSDLILREVAGQHVIVPVGKRVQEVTSIVYISSSAAYLWEYMKNNEFEIDDLMNDEYVFAHAYNNMYEFSHFHHDNIQPTSSVLDAENIRKDSASSFVLSWRIASLAVGEYVTLACDDTVYYLHVCQDKMDFYHLIEIFTHEDLATDDKIEGLCGRLISILKPTKQIVLVAWGHSIEEMNKMSRRGNNGKD